MSENYNVKINFNDSTYDYDFPQAQSIADPKEGMKATIIHGTRGDGAIVIPGGKKSQTITVQGKLWAEDYKALTTLMNTLKSSITTDIATLTMKHYEPGEVIDWAYTVRRIGEINFPPSLRTSIQEYSISFLVISY